MKNMHKNTSVEEDPSFLFNSGGKSEIFKDFYQSDNELNNHSSSEQKIIELSNNNSLIEQEKIKFEKDSFNNISYISEKTDDFIDDSSLKEYFINYKIVTFDEILKKCNYLIKFMEIVEYNKLINQSLIIRCFHDDDNKSKECNRIPIIIKTNFGMKFSCDNKNFTFKMVYDIIEKIIEKKIFVEIPSIGNNSDKKAQQEEKNENKIKIKFIKLKLNGINNIQNKSQKRFCFELKFVEKLIKKFKNKLNEYNNNELQKCEIERKIKNIFLQLSKHINNFIYWLIIKKLIKESLGFKEENANLQNLKLSLENTEILFTPLKEKNTNILSSNSQEQKIKVCWQIPFYYDDETKNILDKNIFIGISKNGYVYIFVMNIAFKIMHNNKYQYIIITKKNLGLLQFQKIILKLKKKNTIENNIKNNYFLISSYIEEIALIINVCEKLDNPLEERFKIELIQKIKYENGLYSSIQIEYLNENYLLNYHKNFTLWFFDPKGNELKSKELTVKKIQYEEKSKKKYIYGPLIQGNLNKNLIIGQIIFPIQIIEIYELTNELCLIQKGEIKLNGKTNYISRENNNYFLYKNKYLFITSFKSKINKENKFAGKIEKKIIKGGIYIFDIEKYICINHITFDDIITFNSILKKNNNIIICSITTIRNKNGKRAKSNHTEGKLILLDIVEKDNEILLNRKEKNVCKGNCKYINYSDFIFESYFLCSSEDTNGVVELNQKNEFIHYFNIYA